jgi:hypothetical protein
MSGITNAFLAVRQMCINYRSVAEKRVWYLTGFRIISGEWSSGVSRL